MSRVTFHRMARKELNEAIHFFDEQAPGLGSEFLDAVLYTAERARLTPHIGTPGEANTRRLQVRGFPYSVVYLLRRAGPRIIAGAHYRRRADYWLERIR